MKKTLLLLVFLLMPLLAAQAQVFRIGAKVGGGFSMAAGSDASSDYTNSLAGLHAGFLFAFEFTPAFSAQFEPQYSQKGFVYENYPISATEALNGDLRLHYLELPLMFRYRKAALFLEAGPYAGYLLAVNSDVKLINPNDPNPEDPVILGDQDYSRSDFKDMDYGYAVGAGITLTNGFSFGFRHMGSLRSIPAGDMSQRNVVFQLSLGYLLPASRTMNYPY